MIGFSETDYTVDEDAGTVQLFLSVQEGAIPDGETRTVMLTTNQGSAQGTCIKWYLLDKLELFYFFYSSF